MVMELCDLDTLLSSLPGSTLLGPDPFGTFASRKVPIMLAARDIAAGCLYLHDNDVVHGDLKASNILVRVAPCFNEHLSRHIKVLSVIPTRSVFSCHVESVTTLCTAIWRPPLFR